MPISEVDFQVKPFSFLDKIKWRVLPNRCVLCGKWKLWGKTPHKKCEDYELSR